MYLVLMCIINNTIHKLLDEV
ncbi:hypothetical protein ACQ27_gp680 [Klebsiella phage K64-1]|nr:hypothetical protein ACQ27_gp680 [Klebsiella phage K64-1]